MDILQAEAIADGYTDGYTSPNLEFSDEEQSLQTTEPSSTSETLDAEIGDDENLRFLKLSFPGQNLTTLRFVLRKCDDDVLKSVDELLNHELIDEERRLNAIVDGEIGTVDDFFADGTARRKKRKQKQQRGASLRNELDPGVSASRPVTSRWEQINSDVDWMTRVLSLPRTTVQSAYHGHNSSLPAALNALLEDTTWEDCRSHPDHEDNYARLLKSYPGLGPIKVRDVLNATKQQLALANEVAHVLSAWRPSIGSLTTGLARSVIKDSASTTSTNLDDAPRTTDAVAAASRISAEGMSATGCRDMAVEYASKRDAAFRQAAAAHQKSKSDGLHGGTATYYAELGREHDAKMRAWNIKAAQMTSVQRSGSGDDLDLHGLSVHEALVVVREGVTRWYAKTRLLESGTSVHPLRIVTGKGLHSSGGEARLLPAVKKYLDREGWRHTVSGGCFTITGLQKA